jgi:hypothetical protein
MSLSRKEYVVICQTCIHRKFDKKTGLVCSLTNAYADFDDDCSKREADPLAEKREERMAQRKDEMQNNGQSNGVSLSTEKGLMQSGGWGGFIMILGGVAWLIGGLVMDRIFFYPFFLIIGGLVVLVKAGIKKSKQIYRPDTSDILDDDFDEIEDL